MKLMLVFVDEKNPKIEQWNMQLQRILAVGNDVCLVSIVSTEPLVFCLYSVNLIPNKKTELKDITSLTQLVQRANGYTGPVNYENSDIMLWLHTSTPSAINGVILSGDEYSFHRYQTMTEINLEGKKIAKRVDVPSGELKLFSPPPALRKPYEPIKNYPKEFKAALERKKQLEKEVAGCWLCNQRRALVELNFWKAVFNYRDTNPFASLRHCVLEAKAAFEKAGTYAQVVHGYCCKTKSWSVINDILNTEHDPEKASLLEMTYF